MRPRSWRLGCGGEAGSRHPRREDLRRSLRKEEPLRGSVSYGFAAADPGVRAGVFDSASGDLNGSMQRFD
jgi:hypothetical protein